MAETVIQEMCREGEMTRFLCWVIDRFWSEVMMCKLSFTCRRKKTAGESSFYWNNPSGGSLSPSLTFKEALGWNRPPNRPPCFCSYRSSQAGSYSWNRQTRTSQISCPWRLVEKIDPGAPRRLSCPGRPHRFPPSPIPLLNIPATANVWLIRGTHKQVPIYDLLTSVLVLW